MSSYVTSCSHLTSCLPIASVAAGMPCGGRKGEQGVEDCGVGEERGGAPEWGRACTNADLACTPSTVMSYLTDPPCLSLDFAVSAAEHTWLIYSLSLQQRSSATQEEAGGGASSLSLAGTSDLLGKGLLANRCCMHR